MSDVVPSAGDAKIIKTWCCPSNLVVRTDLISKYSNALWINDIIEMPQEPEEEGVPNSASGREGKSDLGTEGRFRLSRWINGEPHPRQPAEHVQDTRGSRTPVKGGPHVLRCHSPEWTGLMTSGKSRLARVKTHILC